jgi:hypothetical protein
MKLIESLAFIEADNAYILPGGAYLNFSVPHASDGYGIRDYAGTIQAKSSGGNWRPISLFTEGAGGADLASSSTLSATIVEGKSGIMSGGGADLSGAYTLVSHQTELLSTTAGTTVNSSMNIPAGSIILAVSARVTVTLSATATNVVVKGATTGYTFSATMGVTPASTAQGLDKGVYVSGATEKIQLVANSACVVTGRVRLTVHYITITPPTS